MYNPFIIRISGIMIIETNVSSVVTHQSIGRKLWLVGRCVRKWGLIVDKERAISSLRACFKITRRTHRNNISRLRTYGNLHSFATCLC